MFNLASGNHFKDTTDLKTRLLSLDERVLRSFEYISANLKNAIPAASEVKAASWIGKSRQRKKNRRKVDQNDASVDDDASDATPEQHDDAFVDVNNRFAALTTV